MPATPLCAGPLTGQVVAAEQSANGSSDLATPTGAPSHKMLLPWEAQPAPMTPAALHREQMQVKCAVTALPRAKADPRLCAEAFAQVHPPAAPLPDHICVRPLLPDFGVLSLARSICAFQQFLTVTAYQQSATCSCSKSCHHPAGKHLSTRWCSTNAACWVCPLSRLTAADAFKVGHHSQAAASSQALPQPLLLFMLHRPAVQAGRMHDWSGSLMNLQHICCSVLYS